MRNRHIISYVLFAIAAFLLLFGLLTGQARNGVLLGLAFALGGVFFYRRYRRGA